MYAILWHCKSSDWNKDEYDKTKFLVVMKEPLLWDHHTKSCTEAAQQSWHLSKPPADLRRGLRYSTIWLFYKSNLGAPENALAELESTLLCSRTMWKHLEVLRSTGEIAQSVWEDCMLHPDRFTFCWWPNVLGLIWPPQRSQKSAEKGSVMVSVMESRRNKWNKKK
jgi:hypothetical protein